MRLSCHWRPPAENRKERPTPSPPLRRRSRSAKPQAESPPDRLRREHTRGRGCCSGPMEVSMSLVKRFASPSAIAVAALVVVASAAGAFPLRSPQVAVGGTSLQTYLNGVGESINVNTDQLDAQVWDTSVSGNATFTLMIELAGNAALNTIGIYNANNAAPLFQVFPGAASAGWF